MRVTWFVKLGKFGLNEARVRLGFFPSTDFSLSYLDSSASMLFNSDSKSSYGLLETAPRLDTLSETASEFISLKIAHLFPSPI